MDADASRSTAAETDDPLTGDLELQGEETERVKGGGVLPGAACTRCGHQISSHPRTAAGQYYCTYTGYHVCST